MMDSKWISMAIKENRICAECGRPVAKKYWRAYLKRGHCYLCHLATHWSDNLSAGGSSRYDNRSNEDHREYQS